MSNTSQIIEALLFSTPEPLSISDLKSITKESKKTINSSIVELNKFYTEQERSFEIVQVAVGYQIRTKKKFSQWIIKNQKIKKNNLSPSALETLSVIAYRQPVSKQQINKIRRVDSTGTVKKLLQKKLIQIDGRSDAPGKPLIYTTSTKFLETLGLKKIIDLPQPQEE